MLDVTWSLLQNSSMNRGTKLLWKQKVKEYIGELDDEYARLEVELEKHLDDEACVVTEFETKMVTLLEVKNDLQGRLEETI